MMHNNIMYIDFMPLVSNPDIKEEALNLKRAERQQRQRRREEFCMYASAFLGAGSLFVGLFALTIISAVL